MEALDAPSGMTHNSDPTGPGAGTNERRLAMSKYSDDSDYDDLPSFRAV